MKARLGLWLIVTLVLLPGLSACTAAVARPAAAQNPPAQPPGASALPSQPPLTPAIPASETNSAAVLDMIARLNAGDVEGSLAYFADDSMSYLMGFPPTGIEIYPGKDRLRSLWQDSAANHFKWEAEITQAAGDLVNVRTRTWHDFTRQLGVAPLEYVDVYEFKAGKIIAYGSWLTEQSLARLKPALAAVLPPEPAATLAAGPPVSRFPVTISAGTCATGGPLTLKAGEVTVTLDVQDHDNALYALTLFNLDPGKDLLDLMTATLGPPPSWGDMLLYKELGPGRSDTYTFTLQQGPVYLICWSQPPDLPIGNAGPIPVAP